MNAGRRWDPRGCSRSSARERDYAEVNAQLANWDSIVDVWQYDCLSHVRVGVVIHAEMRLFCRRQLIFLKNGSVFPSSFNIVRWWCGDTLCLLRRTITPWSGVYETVHTFLTKSDSVQETDDGETLPLFMLEYHFSVVGTSASLGVCAILNVHWCCCVAGS